MGIGGYAVWLCVPVRCAIVRVTTLVCIFVFEVPTYWLQTLLNMVCAKGSLQGDNVTRWSKNLMMNIFLGVHRSILIFLLPSEKIHSCIDGFLFIYVLKSSGIKKLFEMTNFNY